MVVGMEFSMDDLLVESWASSLGKLLERLWGSIEVDKMAES